MSSEEEIQRKSSRLNFWQRIEEAVGFFFLALFMISVVVSIYEYLSLKEIWMTVSTMIFIVLLPIPMLLVTSSTMQIRMKKSIIQSLTKTRRAPRRPAEQHV